MQVLAAIQGAYPSLASLPESLVSDGMLADCLELSAMPGDTLFGQGHPCKGLPMILSGEVAVARDDAIGGRTVELYRVFPGEICVISAASLLGQADLQARGAAVSETRLVLLSPPVFDAWASHPPFRQFVFSVYAARLADLTTLIDAIAFQRLDRRLADHLLGHGTVLRVTHQALADELGTVRRIVTRLLNRFEADGLVRLGRERIEVLDAQGLRTVASGQVTTL